jgi:hypothetical protein
MFFVNSFFYSKLWTIVGYRASVVEVCRGSAVGVCRASVVEVCRGSAVGVCRASVVEVCRGSAVGVCRASVVEVCRGSVAEVCRGLSGFVGSEESRASLGYFFIYPLTIIDIQVIIVIG